MKKIISFFIACSLAVGMIVPGIAGAETSLEANLKRVQDLTNQIKALQDQIFALQKQQAELRVSTNSAVIEIIQGLREGSEGDQVTALQTLLAADASLYPEGLVTGYYGPLTRHAVQRFQAKHGLEQVGFIGPRTRSLLNTWLHEKHDNHGNGKDKDDDNGDDHDNDDMPSDSAPAISMIVASPTQTGAIITWKTDERSIGKVYYGTANPLDVATASSANDQGGWLWNWWFSNSLNRSFKTSHSVRINNLSASTTYYFVIESKDKKGNVTTSSQQSFATSGATGDTTAPVITAMSTSNISTSTVTVSWNTDESANSTVYYATSTPLDTSTALVMSEGALVTGHALTLTDLAPDTTYYLKVESTDAAGNTQLSSETSFTTGSLPPADTTAPVISSVGVSATTTGATITWTTDEAATSKAYYGTTTPLSLGTALTLSSGTLVESHALDLVDLATSTTYYYVVESKDATNNTATSTESSFVTGS